MHATNLRSHVGLRNPNLKEFVFLSTITQSPESRGQGSAVMRVRSSAPADKRGRQQEASHQHLLVRQPGKKINQR